MEDTDYGIEITRVSNGFILTDSGGNRSVVETREDNELDATVRLLRGLADFFQLQGSKHDPARLLITVEVGDDYIPQDNEEILEDPLRRLVPKLGLNPK